MPLKVVELERANARLAELRRRLNAPGSHDIADVQRDLLLLADCVTSMLHVLDKTVAEMKRPSR